MKYAVIGIVLMAMLAGCQSENTKEVTSAFVAGFSQGIEQQVRPAAVEVVREEAEKVVEKVPKELQPIIVQGTQTDWTNPQAVGSYGTALAVALGAYFVNRKKKEASK